MDSRITPADFQQIVLEFGATINTSTTESKNFIVINKGKELLKERSPPQNEQPC